MDYGPNRLAIDSLAAYAAVTFNGDLKASKSVSLAAYAAVTLGRFTVPEASLSLAAYAAVTLPGQL